MLGSASFQLLLVFQLVVCVLERSVPRLWHIGVSCRRHASSTSPVDARAFTLQIFSLDHRYSTPGSRPTSNKKAFICKGIFTGLFHGILRSKYGLEVSYGRWPIDLAGFHHSNQKSMKSRFGRCFLAGVK